MKVLLTGSTSCIGQYVAKQLEQNSSVEELVCVSRKYEPYYGNLPSEQRVKRVECHLDKYQWTDRLLSEFKPTHVVHIAGNGSQQASPRQTYTDNLVTTANLLDRVPEGCDFTLLSSIVCDKPARNAYTLAKHEAERLLQLYHEQERVHGKVIRTCAIVGYGSKRGLIPDLVKKIHIPGIQLKGVSPGSKKPFVWAEELAQYIIQSMLRATSRFEIDSFGPNDSLTVEQVTNIVLGEYGIYNYFYWDNVDSPTDQKEVSMPAGTIISESNSTESIKRALRDIMKGHVSE